MNGLLPKGNDNIMRKLLVSLLAIAIAGSSLFAQTVEFIEPRNVQGVPEAEFSTYKVGDNFYVLQKNYYKYLV